MLTICIAVIANLMSDGTGWPVFWSLVVFQLLEGSI